MTFSSLIYNVPLSGYLKTFLVIIYALIQSVRHYGSFTLPFVTTGKSKMHLSTMFVVLVIASTACALPLENVQSSSNRISRSKGDYPEVLPRLYPRGDCCCCVGCCGCGESDTDSSCHSRPFQRGPHPSPADPLHRPYKLHLLSYPPGGSTPNPAHQNHRVPEDVGYSYYREESREDSTEVRDVGAGQASKHLVQKWMSTVYEKMPEVKDKRIKVNMVTEDHFPYGIERLRTNGVSAMIPKAPGLREGRYLAKVICNQNTPGYCDGTLSRVVEGEDGKKEIFEESYRDKFFDPLAYENPLLSQSHDS
ncbi:hypothetical protein F5880DRAFT_1703902 [Lentinula raphanica]|nr:hypothetical protein F5880DRAFT_1703902 [Lentinula raphanica]